MRKVYLLFSMLLVIGLATAYAQGGGQRGGQRGQGGAQMNPEAMAKQRAQAWQETFGLSEDQYKKTYEVLLASQKKSSEKMQELRASGDRTGMRAAMEKIQGDVEKELKTIFSSEQWTKYEVWKKENPPVQRRGGGN